MAYWTNKQWGALIGALIVFLIITINIGPTAIVIVGGLVGYFIGKFLDGELDVEDIRARAQGRSRDQYGAPVQREPVQTRRPPM